MPEGLWWAVTTVATVGYGDAFPTTPVARGFAVVLMLVGIGLFGLLAGSLASFFLHRENQDDSLEEHSEYREILERLERIGRHLDVRARDPDGQS